VQIHEIDKQKRSFQVACAVQDTIANMGLKPGDKLPSQSELARQLNVSIPTLREGLERLELVGLVKAVHGKGTIVSSPTSDNFQQTFGPILGTQASGQGELAELFIILQTYILHCVIQADNTPDIKASLRSVLGPTSEDELVQGLVNFYKTICYGYNNQTVLSLNHITHELILFHAKEKNILSSHEREIKNTITDVANSLEAKDSAALDQAISSYAKLLEWKGHDETRAISLGTGSSGGSFDRLGSNLAAVMSHGADLKMNLIPTGGGIENIDLTDLRRAELSITQEDIALNAYKGEGGFVFPHSGLRAVCRLAPLNLWAVVRADSSICQLTDLKTSRISAGAVGSDAAVITDELFAVLGFKKDSYRTFQLCLINALAALRSREIDAFFYLSQDPFDALVEFHQVTPIRVLPISPDISRLVLNGHASWQISCAHFEYETANSPASIETIGIPTLLITRDDVDDGIIGEIAAVIEQNTSSLLPNADGWLPSTRDYLFDGLSIPLHAGVDKYLRRSEEEHP